MGTMYPFMGEARVFLYLPNPVCPSLVTEDELPSRRLTTVNPNARISRTIPSVKDHFCFFIIPCLLNTWVCWLARRTTLFVEPTLHQLCHYFLIVVLNAFTHPSPYFNDRTTHIPWRTTKCSLLRVNVFTSSHRLTRSSFISLVSFLVYRSQLCASRFSVLAFHMDGSPMLVFLPGINTGRIYHVDISRAIVLRSSYICSFSIFL